MLSFIIQPGIQLCTAGPCQATAVAMHKMLWKCRLAGKRFMRYHSPINATLLRDADGRVLGNTMLRQIVRLLVLQHVASSIAS